jgi:hypothetical protein
MKQTGVILAMPTGIEGETIEACLKLLESRFPGVTFAIAGGATSSVAFEFSPPSPGGPVVWFDPDA